MKVFVKDPDAVLDYLLDWGTDYLEGDTITSSSFSVESGLTKDSESNTDTTTVVVVSGGEAGKWYKITNTVVLASGNTDDRSFTIRVQEK